MEKITDGPIGLVTVFKRQNSRSGKVLEGTMEVVEFIPNKVMEVLTHDANVVINGKVVFESITEGQTKITLSAETPGMDTSMDTSFLKSKWNGVVFT